MRNGEVESSISSSPRADAEAKYLQLFATGDFCPRLIFLDEAIAATASRSPEALWKLQNLRKMQA